MSGIVQLGMRIRGRWLQRAYDRAARDPRAAQERTLLELLHRNQDTAFGREHGFADITSVREYQQRVPIRDYEGHRPWVERLLAGERHVLTHEQPILFATTSGTTDRPKLVPVTPRCLKELSRLMGLWLHRAQLDHPGLFDGCSATLVSPAIEGHSASGAPIGSVSGLTTLRAPWPVRRTYAVPYEVSEIEDYDHRYLAAARYILAADVSLLAAPNPGTLLRLAREGEQHGAEIVRAVHDGVLGVSVGDVSTEQRDLYARLEQRLRPDRRRAQVMARCLELHGRLLPRELWPRLSMLGCWLGGSAGVQAERLSDAYGEVPRRDLGLRATEATITVPFEDETAAGPLAIHTGCFEFIPEDEIDADAPSALLAHELQDGGRYYVLLTTNGGLYRYDINDVVEVQGFRGVVPRLAFLRKGRDMMNLAGEKLHSAQVAMAAERAARELGMDSVEVLLIPDATAVCYDLLVECAGGASARAQDFASAFDTILRELNIEYAQKRGSERLGPPRPVAMTPGWAARRRRADVEQGGKREAQYKWPYFLSQWDESARAEIAGEQEPRAPSAS